MTALAAAALVLVLGFAAVIRPLETRVALRVADFEREDLALRERLALASQRPALARSRNDLRRRLATTGIGRSPEHRVAELLRLVAGIAVSAGVDVTAVAGQAANPLAVQLTLRGGYRDVIGTLRRLIAAPPAARVALASIVPAPHGASAELVAVVDVDLPTGSSGAAARPR